MTKQEYLQIVKANQARAMSEGYLLSGPLTTIGMMLHLEDTVPGLRFRVEHELGKIKAAESMIREALYCKHHGLDFTDNVHVEVSEYTKDGWINLEEKLEENRLEGINLGLSVFCYTFIAGNKRFSLNPSSFINDGRMDLPGYIQLIADINSGNGYRVKWVINNSKGNSTLAK